MNKEISKKKDFIIFGSGNYHTLGIMHALHEVGKEFFVLVVGDYKNWKDGNIVGHSRFWKDFHQVGSEEEGAEWLEANKHMFPEGTVVFPTGDAYEKVLDMNMNTLYGHYLFPNAGVQGRICGLMDKHLQAELASEEGITTLRDFKIRKNADLSDIAVEYPCMLKPLNSIKGSKGDMGLCENVQELEKALKDSGHTDEFIVQQYIKNEADLLFLGISTPSGEIELFGLVKKPDVSPIGEYSYAWVTTDVKKHLPEIDNVKNFIRKLGYIGPFSVEFGLENGRNYLFEINLRNDGTSHYILNTGINLPYMFYKVMKVGTLEFERKSVEYEMIDETIDLRRVLYRQLSLAGWIKRLKKAGAFQYYHKDDKKIVPYLLLMVMQRTCGKLSRMVKRRK